MRLDFFMVAEAATAVDGQFYIHGGSLTNVAPPELPWVHPQLALVLRVEVDPPDEGLDHIIEIRLRDPTGREPVPALRAPVPAKDIPERLPERSIFVIAALTVAHVPFQRSGGYEFVVDIDGVEAGRERIHVHDPPGASI